MITTTDIGNIIYSFCRNRFSDFAIYQHGNIPSGVVNKERITIFPKSQTASGKWIKNFVEVNFCIPNKNGGANLIRLNEIESQAFDAFKIVVGNSKGLNYKFGYESIGQLEDKNLNIFYINVRVKFQVININ